MSDQQTDRIMPFSIAARRFAETCIMEVGQMTCPACGITALGQVPIRPLAEGQYPPHVAPCNWCIIDADTRVEGNA